LGVLVIKSFSQWAGFVKYLVNYITALQAAFFFGVYSTIRASVSTVGHILKVTHQVAALTRPAYMYASALLSQDSQRIPLPKFMDPPL